MSNNHIQLKLQPPRSYTRKRRLANTMRSKGRAEEDIQRVVWHQENSPQKHLNFSRVKPTSPFATKGRRRP